MEKKLIVLTEDELWMWHYWAERGDGSSCTPSSPESPFSDISLIANESGNASADLISSEDEQFTPDNNEVLRRYQEEQKLKPSPTKTQERIIADQRFLHIMKMAEDDDYRTSFNTMVKRNQYDFE